jgi:hypothetical protein
MYNPDMTTKNNKIQINKTRYEDSLEVINDSPI